MVDKILHRTQDKVQDGKSALANTKSDHVETAMHSPVLFADTPPENIGQISAGASMFSGCIAYLTFGDVLTPIALGFFFGAISPVIASWASVFIMPRTRVLNKEFDGKADAEAVRYVRRIQKGLAKGQSATVSLNGLIDDTLMEGIAKRHGMELSLAVYPRKLKLKWTRMVEPGEQWDKTMSDIEAVYTLEGAAGPAKPSMRSSAYRDEDEWLEPEEPEMDFDLKRQKSPAIWPDRPHNFR